MNLLIPRDNFNLNDPSMCKNGDSSIVDVRNRIIYIYIYSAIKQEPIIHRQDLTVK